MTAATYRRPLVPGRAPAPTPAPLMVVDVPRPRPLRFDVSSFLFLSRYSHVDLFVFHIAGRATLQPLRSGVSYLAADG